jgi:SAM-dependent methyltransferase
MSYQAFNAHAGEYDSWFDSKAGSAIFAMEVDCLKPLLRKYKRPYLEVGTGSGRFAQALGIEYGVDPAPALLGMARARGIKVLEVRGEELPFPDKMFGGILIAFTLCFVSNPARVLHEAWRVLRDGGGLVLGLILKDSPWAEFYISRGKEGHPIYNKTQFFSKDEMERLLHQSRFADFKYRSILLQPPGQSNYQLEYPINSYRKSAGFTTIVSLKQEG